MRKKWIPLQRIVILTVAGIFLLLLIEISVLNRHDYNYLIEEKGRASLTLISRRTAENVSCMLSELQIADQFYAEFIQQNRLYDNTDLSEILSYTQKVAERVQKEMPQVSRIHYADLKRRSAGYLIPDGGGLNLFLQDSGTTNELTFYKGKSTDSPVIRAEKGYDPTLQPWFTKVMENHNLQWSDAYISRDTADALSISSIRSILDDSGKLIGVACMDMKMSELRGYLQEIEELGSGVVYIMTSGHELIASSNDTDFIEASEDNSASLEIPKATECPDLRISESASYILNNISPVNQVLRITIDQKRYFGTITPITEPSIGLEVVTLIPEDALVGDILKTQYFRAGFLIILFLIGTALATLILTRFLRPILQVARQAEQISLQSFGEQIDDSRIPIAESHQLVSAFNHMSVHLQSIIEEIKSSEDKFRTLVENSDDMICSLSPTGEILMLNESNEKFFNLQKETYIGKNLLDSFTDEEEKEIWKRQWNRMLESRKKITFTFETHNYANEDRILNVQLLPQFNASDELTNVIRTQTDVTELLKTREQIEELLKSENERLEAIVKLRTEELNNTMKELMDREKMASLGGLVSGVAHEINTPLGVAVTASSFLMDENAKIMKCIEEGNLTKQLLSDYLENTEESTKIISSNLERASNLITSFKKISVNQTDEAEMRFNLYDYLQSILLMLKHEYKNTGHSFEIDCPRDLYLVSYPGAYSQIFTNLIMNSLIHGFQNKEAGQISIHAKILNAQNETDGILRIEYRDNGVGIPEENLKYIFDPFFTTTRGNGKNSGSGLGLSIVYNLVTVTLKGMIECISMPAKGVLFTIEIPIHNYSLTE